MDKAEINGHVAKAEHNLQFVGDVLKLGYNDWCITGCYYASYHIVLALILTKGYSSKNHLATLCVLIKEFYNRGVNKEDIELIDSLFIDYHDLLFYVESKNKREEASYSSRRMFDKNTVEKLRLKAALFVDKVKTVINKSM
ncbi:MAG TPA: HEPN domain-containing protein [Candidatus Nanoarchaeia archaeon]|nr:HEPN domain-containing protein [Candidatus Nanoarchaeia archaeon]